MTLFRPTRREFIASIPLIAGAASLPAPLLAQPAETPLNFLVVGDWGRGGHHNQQAVADLMGEKAAEKHTAFIASTGDNFYMFGVSGVDDPKWRSSFENVYRGPGYEGVPWYPVLGNHDYGGNVQAQIDYGRAHPGRWQMKHHYYQRSLTSPGGATMDLFFIDTVMWIGREGFPFYFLGSRIGPDDQRRQAAWLVAALGASRARFKFVFGHHGIHSIGPHGGEMQMAQLDDVLRRFGVTAYIHGHDHCLFHISHSAIDPGNGTGRQMHYICSGGGSQILATYTGGPVSGCVYRGFCDAAGADSPFPHWQAFIRDAGYAAFDVYRDRVDFRFHNLSDPSDRGYHATLT